MDLNHPNVIRMDLFHGVSVDVVADVSSMPFREGAFDLVMTWAADRSRLEDEELRRRFAEIELIGTQSLGTVPPHNESVPTAFRLAAWRPKYFVRSALGTISRWLGPT
jgi:hypothetical protein